MQVHTDINNLPEFKNAAITIGTFDGVHNGHRLIINQLKNEAQKNNGESVLITFDPHPRMVITPAADKPIKDLELLNTLEEKISLLASEEIDHLVVVPFTEFFANLTAEEYIKDFLVDKFSPHTIIIGFDHHFGKGRSGNYKLLEQFSGEGKYSVKEIPQYILEDVAISSTRIRESLTSGKVRLANKLLGYDYYFSGLVVEGDKIGRTLGYPTANIQINDPHKLVPANGIYIVHVQVNGKMLNGMLSIGVRPTFGINKRSIEVNILDFEQDIYGTIISIFLKEYIRPELKFNGIENLVTKMREDEEISRQYFQKIQEE